MHHERAQDLSSGDEQPLIDDEEQAEIGLLSLPEDIAPLERLRESAYAGLPDLSRVPTDVFVWRPGEPTRREVTKIGGLCPWLDEPDIVRLDVEVNTPGAPGVYLCTLASVDMNVYAALPGLPPAALAAPTTSDVDAVRAWRRALSAEHHLRRSRSLMIADVGLLNLFLNVNRQVRWTAHCQTRAASRRCGGPHLTTSQAPSSR